ncbi:peptide ABC transporter, permease protein [Rubellimicrobium mesophilum DSM 19309]|uniref:Peptide ABC transporter, permease protein n=1 Tax=Rubellimicrobium mesophilum DSM 19309 TaxID=442562 RepID=A0A017HQK5_9RHOB|nr:ABC transporter permease [Rubellimicrobium mesophilum]EYD76575.1 peptide ABC transporter, permease protein [Rubellimicrobium mesophilum DSM 19309]
MIRYFGGRLLQILPVLFGVSLVVFFLVRLIPGDPAVATLGSRATPQLIARVRDQLGLDLPLWQQYLNFLSHALQGDFGISFFYQASVWDVTIARLPITLMLMVYSVILALIMAVPFAYWSAARRGRVTDHATRILFTIGLGMPVFWSGIMLAYLLGVRWKLLPTSGPGDGGLDSLVHFTLPALTLAISIAPILVRTLRSSLIEVLASDYVTTGRAMGLDNWTLRRSYIIRNSLRPLITVITINFGYLIGGTVIVEQIFSLAGVGSLLIGSISTRDYAVIQLATLIFALLVVVVNLLGDLLYALIDPRLALGT